MHRCRELENFCDYTLADRALRSTDVGLVGSWLITWTAGLHAGAVGTDVVAEPIANIIYFLLNWFVLTYLTYI
jgi:hypothetical protein